MNLINPNNIDKWLFDYFEGNLSLHEKIEVESFLKNNPEFQADFDAWQESFLPETSFTYQHTNSLIKKAAFPKGLVALFFVIALIGGGTLVYLNLPESNGQLSKNDALNNTENLTSNNSDSKLVKNQFNKKTIEVNTNENIINTNTSIENIMANGIDESDLNSVAIDNHSQTNPISFTQNNLDKGIDQSSGLASESKINNLDNDFTSNEDINNNITEDVNTNPADDLSSEMTAVSNQGTPIVEEISSNVEANGVSLSIIRSVRKGVKMEHFVYKEVSKEYLTSSFVKSHKGYTPINHAEKDYKNKKSEKTYPNYKSHRNESMAKNLTRLFNKDLALTVFNNRIMMKDNLMSLGANQSLAGSYKTPRVQMGYSQSLQKQSPYSAYLSTDARIKNHGIGFKANFNDIANYQFYDASLIYAYNLDLGGFKLRPSVSGKYGKDAQISTDASGTSTTISSDNITIDGGLMIETPSFYLGAQSKNMGLISYNKSLNQEDLFQGNRGYSFVIGTDYRKTFQQNLVVSPQIYLDLVNGQKPTYTFATTANMNGLVGGASYASNNNMGLMIGGQLRNFRIMYHANTNLEVIKAANFGQVTHELGLQFMISKKTKGYLLYD